MATYKKIFIDNRKIPLAELIELLNRNQRRELIEDILVGRLQDIESVLEDTQLFTPEAIAFNWLVSDLPHYVRREAVDVFDKVFEETLQGKYSPEDAERIQARIKAFTARNKFGLSKSYILNKLGGLKAQKDHWLRLDLLLLLSKLGDTVDLSYWEQQFDLKATPELAPALISALKRVEPERALNVLLRLQELGFSPAEEDYSYYKANLRIAVFQQLQDENPEKIRSFATLRQHLNAGWAMRMLDDILSHPRFDAVRKKIEEAIYLLDLGGAPAQGPPSLNIPAHTLAMLQRESWNAEELLKLPVTQIYDHIIEAPGLAEEIARLMAEKGMEKSWKKMLWLVINRDFLHTLNPKALNCFRDFFSCLFQFKTQKFLNYLEKDLKVSYSHYYQELTSRNKHLPDRIHSFVTESDLEGKIPFKIRTIEAAVEELDNINIIVMN